MKKYIGLTIGPIYKTLQNAKKTRELWSGSYIFSYIMKRIIDRFRQRPFIIPYVNDGDSQYEKLLTGLPIGLFHDRLIFEAEDDDFDELSRTIGEILNDISRKIADHLGADNAQVAEYVKRYFQLYFCEKEYDVSADYKTINKDINAYLDSFELQNSFILEEERNFVADFLRKINKSFLIEEAFKKKSVSFRSIPEIATISLGLKEINNMAYKAVFQNYDDKEEKSDEEYDIYLDIEKQYGKDIEEIKQYHKYIAIVHADGDNMGKTIEGLKENDDFKRFSKQLFDFDIKAYEAIEAFGGQTIFAGGDDLLFFAPAVSHEGSVFELVDRIDQIFNTQFEKNSQRPTLSFGVSISYYKFPLYEALNVSRELLKAKAKTGKKNAVAFRALKHSGQYFEGVFEKGSPEHECLMKMLNDIGPAGDGGDLMTSIIHTLFAQRSILGLIEADDTRLKNFFKNNFNEPIHKAPQNKNQIDGIMGLISAVYSSANYMNNKERINTVYSALRLNKLMRE